MRSSVVTTLAILLGVASCVAATAATVKVVVPSRGAWDTSFTEFGMQQGFFKEQGLDLELTFTEGSAATEQALISGRADIAVATRFLGILAAYAKGAPVRIISAELTGSPDMFWYAKIAGPVASMKDLHGKAVSFSSPGSSSNLILLKLLKEAGVDDARLIPIGAAPSGYPDVLSAQLDASWGTPPTVINELLSGEIRRIARGNDSPEVQGETRRVNAVNAAFLAAHRSAVGSFLKAYKKSVDWAYSGDAPIKAYAKLADQSIDGAKYVVKEFASPQSNQIDEIKGEDRVLDDALKANRIPHALTHDDVKGVYDLVLTQDR